MKPFVEGTDREQSTLFPECLEDWIDENNPVRVIDVFVDELDLAELGFDGVAPETTGRPGYHPSVLLKLYIYGYLNRVQSSRRLEREALRNVEVMWLTGRLAPDHKTIADFRKDNGGAIRQVCARFIELCRAMGLLTEASVAIDGSKFKAVNNRDKNFTRAKMDRRMAQIEESVARYLQQLDTADRQEPSEALQTKTSRLKDKIAKLKQQMQHLKELRVQMLAAPDQQISLTDPDSRSMATSGRGSGVVGYNVQVAVETKHHLIIAHEVINEGSDRAQLSPMAKAAKAVLAVEKLDAVADRGYFSSEEILACDNAGVTELELVAVPDQWRLNLASFLLKESASVRPVSLATPAPCPNGHLGTPDWNYFCPNSWVLSGNAADRGGDHAAHSDSSVVLLGSEHSRCPRQTRLCAGYGYFRRADHLRHRNE